MRSPSTTNRIIIQAIGIKQSASMLKKFITVTGITIESNITNTGFIIGIIRITETITGTNPFIKSSMIIIDRH